MSETIEEQIIPKKKILHSIPENYSRRNPFDPEEFPNCHAGYEYAVEIVDGKIPSSIYTRGACVRFLGMVLEYSPTWYFDSYKAERYLRLVQKFEHVKGKWNTKFIIYDPWQKWIWMNIMGFVRRSTGQRLFRQAHIEIARGNAKSAMSSQAVLYFLALEESVGNEIATLATKKEQARIVLDSARSMAKKNVSFLKAKRVKVLAHKIVQDHTNSVARALASKSESLDGLNEVLAVLDELHAMTRDTYDVIVSGMSKRNDSLVLCITTAGFNTDSVGASQSFYAKKVCLGEEIDDQFFGVVYTIDDEDHEDIYNENVWHKANPAWNSFIDQITFRAKAMKTVNSPADLPGFKVKHLNIWLSEAEAYFDSAKLERFGADPSLNIENFFGKKSWMSADMANKTDLCSVVNLFVENGLYHFFDKTWLPEATYEKEKQRDLYVKAVNNKHLFLMPGAMIKQQEVEDYMVWCSKNFQVQSAALDPWNSANLMMRLQDDHCINVLEFGMRTGNLSGATKELKGLIDDSLVRYNGSPLLKWNVGNVVCKEDPAQNVFPKKSHRNLKIDIAIAMIMCLATYMQQQKLSSVYEGRELIIL